MNLIAVKTSDLVIGQPLPWDLFNQERQQLLARGDVINTDDELQLLGEAPTFRMQEATPAPAVTDTAPAAQAEALRFQFKDMRLAVGDKLQLSPPSNVGGDRCMVKLIGYIEDVTLMVGAPPSGQWRPSAMEGDQIAIRVFSGQNAFGFNAYVDKIIKLPFSYLHLSFPKQIFGKVIRKSRRIKAGILVTLADNAAPAVISNLSATGAEVRANSAPGALGATIQLSSVLKIHGAETPLALQAVIRSLKQDHDGVEGAVRCGVEFQNLQLSDVAALQSLIYQELVDNPKNLA